MRPEFLQELGLSPRWIRRARDGGAPAPALDSPAPPPAAASGTEPPPAAKKDSPQEAPAKPAATATPATATAQPAAAQTAEQRPAAAESAIAKMGWQPLRETVASCQRCELCKGRTQAVFGVGDDQADILFVGEGPGQEEDRRGEPFVGPAGKLLDAMLRSISLARDQGVYIANIVKCRPPLNRNPKREEAESCMPFLRRQITLIKPELIVAMGGVAAAHLLEIENPRIGELRQRLHDCGGVKTVVTYHPAYLLRNPEDKRKAWSDLLFIRNITAKNS